MLISICIPVYNQYIKDLLHALELQSSKLEDVELVIIDDFSDENIRKKNRTLLKSKHLYFENYKNKGRAQTRNLFLEKSSGEYLLFLDGDSKMIRSNFIKRYYDFTKSRTRVVCGGMEIPAEKEKGKELRYNYAKEVELKTFLERLEHPYQQFKTNNFMIRRDIFEKHRFSTQLKGYGHEDTLLAFELERKRIPIDHIDNPVLHNDIDDNLVYINKTKEALKNLAMLHAKKGQRFTDFVRLLSVYESIKQRKLMWLLRVLAPLSKPYLYTICVKGKASVKQFNWYKMVLFVGYRKGVNLKKS